MEPSHRRPGPSPRADDAAPIGRDRELALVAGFLTAGWPRLLLLDGPAGIGKSTVLDAAASLARRAGANPLVARPAQAEADVPHAVLTSLLPDDRIAAVLPGLAPPRRRALEIALRRETAAGADLDPAALGLAVLDVLRAIGRPLPALVVVDDLQWTDAASAAALAYALRRAGELPLGVLAAARTGIESVALHEVLGALPGDRVERIAVGPMSIGAIGPLLEARTGRARGRSAVVRIVEAAGGNPLLAIELARAMDAAGREPAAGEALALPPSAEPLLAERLARLTPAADDAVLEVALGGGLAPASVGDPAALDEALRAGLLELDGSVVRLGHPLVGAAAIGRASPARRRALHRRLAGVATTPAARARHLALAADGPDAEAAAACDGAAEDAARHGAGVVAAELAELAVGLTPPTLGAQVAIRRCRAAARRLVLGDADAARAHLDAGLAAATDPEEASPLRIVGVELAYVTAGRPAARQAAVDALAAAGTDPILRARAHAAMLSWGAEDTRDERRIAAEVLELLAGREREAPDAAADALAVLADARLAAGHGPAFGLLERAIALDRMRSDAVVGSRSLLAATLRTADRIAESRRAFAVTLERLSRAGWESRRVNDLAHAAWTEVMAGDHLAADRLLAESAELGAQLGLDATGTRIYRAYLDVVMGREVPAAIRAAEAGLAAAQAARDPWTAALWHRTLGMAALLGADPEAAARHLEAALETALEMGILEPNWARLDADLVEALVGAGRLDEAAAALDGFRARAASAALPWARVAVARSTALLLVARGDPEGALAALDDALEATVTLELALERNRTLLVRGSVLRRLRRVRDARVALEAAAAGFAELPSAPWEARARGELARLGGRAASGGALTPAERQVARLAAAGRSNREIAAELVVSVRTVESQLAAAYAKLGVRGRGALGPALDADEAASSGA